VLILDISVVLERHHEGLLLRGVFLDVVRAVASPLEIVIMNEKLFNMFKQVGVNLVSVKR
jgi:hypothetical protein